MNLPENVKFIIDRLNSRGYEAYAVGGCVRDHLLGKAPEDYDMTTSATPDEMKAVFSDLRVIETGIKHGTLTVLIDSVPHEITTYRIDGEYTDNRHPSEVTFTRKLREDLARRDFTVNAMAYSPRGGLADFFGGVDDLKKGVIRAVGDPMLRFSEDALRIMRALRFSATLGFRIDDNTAEAVRAKKELLKNVSRERIYTEWKKLISGKDAYRVLTDYREVVEFVIPELSGYVLPDESRFLSAPGDVRELSLFVTDPCDKTQHFHALGRFSSAMYSLKTDTAHMESGLGAIGGLSCRTSKRTDVHELLVSEKEESRVEKIIRLKILLGTENEGALEILRDLIRENVCYKLSDLKINGNDLIALGYKGKAIGDELIKLLFLVARGKIENEREALLGAAEGVTKK